MSRIDLSQQLQQSKEYRRAVASQGYYFALKLFSMNYRELKSIFQYHQKNHNNYLDLRKQNEAIEIIDETTRLTYNYLQSAASLVNHTRNWYRRNYEPTREFLSYSKKTKSSFADDPLHNFLMELRNIISHEKIIIPQISTSLMSGETMFFVSKTLLLQHDLKKISKDFLALQEDQIDLESCITKYYSQIIAYYKWIESELRILHFSDWQYVRNIEQMILAPQLLSLPNTIKIFIQDDNPTLNEFEGNLLGVFSNKDCAQISGHKVNSKPRATAIIKILNDLGLKDKEFESTLLSICQ